MTCKYCGKEVNTVGALAKHEFSCKRLTGYMPEIIQLYETNSICVIASRFNIGKATVTNALKNAGVKLRTKQEADMLFKTLNPDYYRHTDESKENLRQKRRDWMRNNPHQTAWRTRNTPSYIEQLFMKICNELGLCAMYDIVREYSVYPYFIDFAFIGIKVAIELDGSQHWSTPDRVEHDRKRDIELTNAGWRIMRIPSFKIMTEYESIKCDVMDFLGDCTTQIKQYNSDIIEYDMIKERRKQQRIKQQQDKRSVIDSVMCARKVEFDAIYPTHGWSVDLGSRWGMTSQAAARYCRKHYGITTQHNRLTESDIIASLSSGMSLSQIGDRYSLDRDTVSSYCRKYNIPIPKQVTGKVNWVDIDLLELIKTKTGAQIARDLHVTPAIVYRKLKELTKPMR